MLWLIELRDALRPQGLYLHVYEITGDRDGVEQAWSADRTRALRFREKHEAERYGFNHVDHDFVASPHPADELVSIGRDTASSSSAAGTW